jgi:hypothetical protein
MHENMKEPSQPGDGKDRKLTFLTDIFLENLHKELKDAQCPQTAIMITIT